MQISELEKLLAAHLLQDENYQIVQKIVRRNSTGKTWLIGGGLSRKISAILHGQMINTHDFDFILEKLTKEVELPKGWTMKTNKYGNPKLIKETLRVDLIPLSSLNSILRRRLQPTIENFLTGTPFDVQSIAYELTEQRLVGQIGLRAIQEKRFGINNLEQARIYASKKGVSLEQLLQDKAHSMGFRPIVPS